MAKVTGALFSMDASGKFGGALVFGKWKGRATVRKLVIPANPKSGDQEIARNMVRVLGAGQHYANVTVQKRSGEALTDKAELIALAPAGQAWNGFLVKSAIGTNQISYGDAENAWTALTSGEKTAWNMAADALSPPIPQVAQKAEGGAAATNATSGNVFFHYAYGLYLAGAMDTVPGAVPPTYA